MCVVAMIERRTRGPASGDSPASGSGPPPTASVPGGRSGPQDAPLYRTVERQVSQLARSMIATFVAEIPIYAMLPREQLHGEITAITEDNLRVFFRTLRENRAPADEELAVIRVSAARRAEERVPLDAVLTAYHRGARVGWRALVAAAGPDDHDALLAAAERVLTYVQHVTGAVAAAYLEEQQAIYGEERDAHRALASALLAGQPAAALAARLGVTIAAGYVLLALQVGTHPDEQGRPAGAAIAARRKLRRLQGRIEAYADGSALSLLDPSGGVVLLPTTGDGPDEVTAGLPGLVAELQQVAGAPVLAGVALARRVDDVAAAAHQARDVLGIAEQLARPPGVYELGDVLLEYQLTRPSAALAALAALLDPLERNPDLLATLSVYLDTDLDRRRTAAALHVHPNTLDYRLRRVVDLTGLDPTTTRGLQMFGAALAARRMREPS